MGNDAAALAGFQHYLTLDPNDPFVHYQMGVIWLDPGDTAKADALFPQGTGAGPAGRGGEERPRRDGAAARRRGDCRSG